MSPEIILLPSKNRPSLEFGRRWTEIESVDHLPERLFVGDLDRSSFRRLPGKGFTARYRDLDFEVELRIDGNQIICSESYAGTPIYSAICDAKLYGPDLITFRPHQSSYDRLLKPRYEAFYVRYLDSVSDVPTVGYWPDGVLKTLLVPFPMDALLVDRLGVAVAHLLTQDVAFSGNLVPNGVIVNYREGKCEDMPSELSELDRWGFRRGYIPVHPATREGSPGDQALTVRWFGYVLRMTFPIRDGLKIVQCLDQHGVIEPNNGTPSERLGVLVPAEYEAYYETLQVWTPDRSRRIVLPVPEENSASKEESTRAAPSMAGFIEKLNSKLSEHLEFVRG